ncbi:YebC/PmpR family DNA-binding transcriptional regulator [Candidatus Woesebacteria bacterium]|nr:YebC/PmpR family DNA-binding transcriptional regulator [Candidatus Woesebacteria bacterium]
MSGHSKWNNIKNKKGAADDKRGKVFSSISKLIRIAVREGKSGDPKFNPTLRVALEKARAANMPKVNVERAIERGLGKTASGTSIHEIAYEGFGAGGVAVIVVAMTDNPNRTAAEVKYAFSRNEGSLGSPGSAMYMFKRTSDGGYECTMPMQIDDNQTINSLRNMVEKLRESEDIEDIYMATEIEEEEN